MAIKFRINQLSELVALALDEAAVGQNSARVREVPDVRTIRYYTTLGLIDRPLEMQGRTAFYGVRHLLQILAIKRMQATGRTLVEIQQELAGANDEALRNTAGLPVGFLERIVAANDQASVLSPANEQPPSPGETARRSFWQQQPADAPTVSEPSTVQTARPAMVLPLAAGVSLLLEGVEVSQLDDDAVTRLQPAVAELLRVLQSLGQLPETGHESQETKP